MKLKPQIFHSKLANSGRVNFSSGSFWQLLAKIAVKIRHSNKLKWLTAFSTFDWKHLSNWTKHKHQKTFQHLQSAPIFKSGSLCRVSQWKSQSLFRAKFETVFHQEYTFNAMLWPHNNNKKPFPHPEMVVDVAVRYLGSDTSAVLGFHPCYAQTRPSEVLDP